MKIQQSSKHRLCIFAAAAAALYSANAAEYKAVTLRPGVTQLFNDNNKWPNVCTKGIAVLPSYAAKAKKIFDLSKLPEGVLKNAKSAALQLHICIVDHSLNKKNITPTGLNEQFIISINGHDMIFYTADARFPSKGMPVEKPADAGDVEFTAGQTTKQIHAWTNVSFPAEWIKDGNMEVVITKPRRLVNDDFIMIGWDITVPNGTSYYTLNNGKTWDLGNGAQPKGMGEYLMRLIISENEKENFELPEKPKMQ